MGVGVWSETCGHLTSATQGLGLQGYTTTASVPQPSSRAQDSGMGTCGLCVPLPLYSLLFRAVGLLFALSTIGDLGPIV